MCNCDHFSGLLCPAHREKICQKAKNLGGISVYCDKKEFHKGAHKHVFAESPASMENPTLTWWS